MQIRDVPKVFDTTKRANIDDPLNRYIKDTPDGGKPSGARTAAGRAVMYLSYSNEAHEKISWTINHGESYLRLGDPLHKKSRLARVVERVVGVLLVGLLTAEQKKRHGEFLRKLRAALEELFGDELERMVELTSIATAPERQGRGYASALVHIVTDLADARGVDSWVVSSNTANRGFYGSFGYKLARTIYLGGDDPTWEKPPVAVDIMVRKPKSMREK
ncbi:GNAT family N-acetyltransferase [Phanerochaete sordida]|uniref:GNAT family N-acetyltransferase n=1 Tax=Phanerochaete sordida TaxID=48140 RepID=A0A9P3GH93_9APHY|nr:GNAT family N-acetyltransferase [Phanerochaete sordida]